MKSHRSSASDVVANLATILVCLLAIVIAFPVMQRLLGNDRQTGPNELSELRGLQIDSLLVQPSSSNSAPAIHTTGKRTIIYQFATDCPFCTAQKAFVASALLRMQEDSTLLVLSASDEPNEVIKDYWGDDGNDLSLPVSLHPETIMHLAAFTVPRLYFLNEAGTITLALQGSVLTLSQEQLLEQIPPRSVAPQHLPR